MKVVRILVITLTVNLILSMFVAGPAMAQTYGVQNEICEPHETIPNSIVLSCDPRVFPNTREMPNRWETIIEEEIEAGSTVLLRDGPCAPQTRRGRGNPQMVLMLRPGITLKPALNPNTGSCHDIIIQGGLVLTSDNLVAGLRIEMDPMLCPEPGNANQEQDVCHAVLIRTDGNPNTDTPDAIMNITLRNNEIIGGGNPVENADSDQGHALSIGGNVSNLDVHGNHINASGLAGHTIRVQGIEGQSSPRTISIAYQQFPLGLNLPIQPMSEGSLNPLGCPISRS